MSYSRAPLSLSPCLIIPIVSVDVNPLTAPAGRKFLRAEKCAHTLTLQAAYLMGL